MPRSTELEAALVAATRAAETVRAGYLARPAVWMKADRTPVTDVDIAAEQAIRTHLTAQFPDFGFYGEETGRAGRPDPLWLVDPIDGTKAFVRGYPFFSTQIALMRREELVIGVSSAPLYGELACAERGRGAELNGRRLRVSDIATIEEATVSGGNLKTLAKGRSWAAWGRLVARVSRIRGYGDFLHYHLLAAGKIDAIVESDVSILDVAALVTIVEEAGGRCTTLSGEPIGLNTTSILATNGHLHPVLLEAIGFRDGA